MGFVTFLHKCIFIYNAIAARRNDDVLKENTTFLFLFNGQLTQTTRSGSLVLV